MYERTNGNGPAADGNILADALKGAVAGAVGVWVMDRVGNDLMSMQGKQATKQEEAAMIDGKQAPQLAAQKAANLAGIELNKQQNEQAGQVVHYLMGIIPGALYGAFRHRVPALGAGSGLVYGSALFVALDEMVNPVLGLSSEPTAYPWQTHARGFVSHLVLASVTNTVINALDGVTGTNH